LELGLAIEKIGRIFKVDPKKVISLVLLGTNKNTGLAAGLALALYGDRTALPATVSTIFMIVYIVWLGFKQRKFLLRRDFNYGLIEAEVNRFKKERRGL